MLQWKQQKHYKAEGVFNNPWKSRQNIFIPSKITAFTIFYSVFQNYAKEMDSHL